MTLDSSTCFNYEYEHFGCHRRAVYLPGFVRAIPDRRNHCNDDIALFLQLAENISDDLRQSVVSEVYVVGLTATEAN